MTKFPVVWIRDINGANVLMYIRLEEGSYFGGKVHPDIEFDMGPHVWHTLSSLLGLLAKIANSSPEHLPYTLDSSEIYGVLIGRRMKADDIAQRIGCEVEEVTDYFRLSVELESADA